MAQQQPTATPGTAKSRKKLQLGGVKAGNSNSPAAVKAMSSSMAAAAAVVPTPTLSLKTPPSPSLNSMNASILSFSMQPQEHRLMPLEEDKLFQQLKDCDKIRYAAYRTAVKLDILQTALKLDSIKFGVVCNVFHHHGLSGGGGGGGLGGVGGGAAEDVVLDRAEAREVISDVFYSSSKVRSYYSPPMDVDALTEAALKNAMLIFDSKDTGGIHVRSLKVFFVLMCEGRLRDKFLYLFRHFSDHNSNMLSRLGLTALLGAITQVPEFFGESVSFGGGLVECSVNQCLAESGEASSSGAKNCVVGEESFNRWLLREPQIIVWLPTHFRLISAKGVRHGSRCSNCRMDDIIGMRYQCLRCINYNLCQHCFFHGHVSRGHKLEHPMQEYCYRSNRRDATKAFVKLLVNNLRKRKITQMKQRYLHPQAALNSKENKRKKRRRLRRKRGADNAEGNSDDSSGFHSGSSSENGDSADGAAAAATTAAAAAASPSPSPSSPVPAAPAADEDTREQIREAAAAAADENDLDLTVIRQDGDQIVMSQHQRMFQSIVINLEEQNKEMMSRLRGIPHGSHDSTAAAGEGMQMQLHRLKSLMETVFSGKDGKEPRAGSVSLSEPSMIESTPLPRSCGMGRKFKEAAGSFSPILKSTAMLPPPAPIAELYQTPEVADEDATERLPSLSEVTFGDLTSLLVKTGRSVEAEGPDDLEQVNVTEQLGPAHDTMDETMEELESLMLKLEQGFQAVLDPLLVARPKRGGIECTIGEIGDLVNAFSTQFIQHHEL